MGTLLIFVSCCQCCWYFGLHEMYSFEKPQMGEHSATQRRLQAMCSEDNSSPWRMGSPFQGLEFASEAALPNMQFAKSSDGPDSQLRLQSEDKHLEAVDRPSTAPSPVPLLDTANHQAFSESLLITEDLRCHPSLHSTLVILLFYFQPGFHSC